MVVIESPAGLPMLMTEPLAVPMAADPVHVNVLVVVGPVMFAPYMKVLGTAAFNETAVLIPSTPVLTSDPPEKFEDVSTAFED